MRRATAYCSSCSQVVFTTAGNCKKTIKLLGYFGCSRSFKVIDTDTTKSSSTVLVMINNYNLCLSATVFTPDKSIAVK